MVNLKLKPFQLCSSNLFFTCYFSLEIITVVYFSLFTFIFQSVIAKFIVVGWVHLFNGIERRGAFSFFFFFSLLGMCLDNLKGNDGERGGFGRVQRGIIKEATNDGIESLLRSDWQRKLCVGLRCHLQEAEDDRSESILWIIGNHQLLPTLQQQHFRGRRKWQPL